MKKALKTLHNLKNTAAPSLQKILKLHSYDTIVKAMKAGMTIEAQNFVSSLVNGDHGMIHNLEKLTRKEEDEPEEHRVGIIIFFQEGKFNTYTSSISDIDSSFIYVSSETSKSVIKSLYDTVNRSPTYLKLLRTNQGLGNDDNKKLCLPLWSMNEAVEALELFSKRESLYKSFISPVDFKRGFIHLIRCLFIVICWTTQSSPRLNTLLRQAFPRSMPPLGLNDYLPLSASFCGKILTKACDVKY